MNHMAIALLLGALTLGGASKVQAQSFMGLTTLAGFTSTLIPNERMAQNIYNQMPTHEFRAKSECFQRAHFWSFGLFQKYEIKSMKIFLFFTARYQREFNYEWFYHVAPALPVQNEDGSIGAKVFDPTFTSSPANATAAESKKYANRPVSIREWTNTFIIPQTECPMIQNYYDYVNAQEKYYCYTMLTPMYTYIPANLETETKVRTAFYEEDLQQMLKALPARERELPGVN